MNFESKNNYYEVLEIPHSATQHEIILAYERAKLTYSVQNPALYTVFTAVEAEDLRKLIDEAYSVLSNQTLRNIYEKRLMSKSYSESDLSLEAIRHASTTIYSEGVLKQTPAINSNLNRHDLFVKNESFEKEIELRTEWSGEFIQTVRNYRKITLDQLHEQTKINPWYLAAIEKMEISNLPAHVFVRGYVVQIAKALQLNEKLVVDSYMKLFKSLSEQKK